MCSYEQFKRKNYDLCKFITEDMIRLFGICVPVMEKGDLSKIEIFKELFRDDKKLLNKKRSLKVIPTETELHEKYMLSLKQTKECQERTIKEIAILQEKITILRALSFNLKNKGALVTGVLSETLKRFSSFVDELNYKLIFIEDNISILNKGFEHYAKEEINRIERYNKEVKETNNKPVIETHNAEDYIKFCDIIEQGLLDIKLQI